MKVSKASQRPLGDLGFQDHLTRFSVQYWQKSLRISLLLPPSKLFFGLYHVIIIVLVIVVLIITVLFGLFLLLL